jgi:hypothetical protein
MEQVLENTVTVGQMELVSAPKSAALQGRYDKMHHYDA